MGKNLSEYNRILSEIYKDQKIRARSDTLHVRIPEKIRSIRSMEKGIGAYRQPRELIFVHQARLLEDYEDDYLYDKEVFKIFPTYQSLNDEQLRGYLGWRTLVRKGTVTRTSQAFAHLYIYELLNLIGCEGPGDAFEKLADFLAKYRQYSKSIVYDEDQWLNDFVVYYGLDPVLMADRPQGLFDQALGALTRSEKRSDPEVFDALAVLSGRAKRRDALSDPEKVQNEYKRHYYLDADFPGFALDEELFVQIAARSYRSLVRYYEANRKTGLFESWIGRQLNDPVKLFATAVVYMPKTERCYDYRFSPFTTYHCERGRWAVKTYRRNLNNRNIADFLRTADYVIRIILQPEMEQVNYGFQTKWMVKLIKGIAEDVLEDRKRKEALRIDFDLSALEGIRNDAAITMDRLMTEEEAAEELAEEDVKPSEETGCTTDDMTSSAPDLSESESRLLISLINDEDLTWVSDNGLLISVLADSVNEKLYDLFADNVIDCTDEPEIIEDYREELMSILGQ